MPVPGLPKMKMFRQDLDVKTSDKADARYRRSLFLATGVPLGAGWRAFVETLSGIDLQLMGLLKEVPVTVEASIGGPS